MEKEAIAIVDDNLVNLKLIKVILELEGYQTYTVTTAEDLDELLSRVTPALILMDLQLPGVSGLELTRKLKADNKYKQIPIIAITAYAMKGDKEKSIEAGCDGYISKPIDVSTFPALIEQFLKGSSVPKQSEKID
ncbi:MAG: response regulator [Gammaproteobacteria bacterium]|nr:response regulator [Gammaproteobacteria bacterium]